MDLLSPFLATDPASPRLTTYTDAGRMELSAATLANWA
ncbi:MAG: TIGR03089 family protein, partial [Corynebacterium sp.]|nr:TIGR03089 family protein [Corynebacterium sp.]